MKAYRVVASSRRIGSLRFYVTAEGRKDAAFKAASYVESKGDSDFYREFSVEKRNKFIYNVIIDKNEEWRLRIDKVKDSLVLREEESV